MCAGAAHLALALGHERGHRVQGLLQREGSLECGRRGRDERRLQHNVTEAVTLCDEGCNTMWRGLQPYAPEAATLCGRRLQVAVDLHAVLGGGEAGEREQALVERLPGT